jgi:serine/threonine-protein kinase RsbW
MLDLELRVANEVAHMRTLRVALDRFGHEHQLPADVLRSLQVAVDEVVSNVIKYAWPSGGTHEVLLRVGLRSDHVEVEIVDDGVPFDPRDPPPPPAFELEAGGLPIGGRGLRLVDRLMDEVDYTRLGNQNRLRIRKSIVKPVQGGVPP